VVDVRDDRDVSNGLCHDGLPVFSHFVSIPDICRVEWTGRGARAPAAAWQGVPAAGEGFALVSAASLDKAALEVTGVWGFNYLDND